MILAYIDARDVEQELDEMFCGAWSCDHKIIKDDERGVVVECRITAWWHTKSDVGFHAYEKYLNGDNYDLLHKSAYNDAFKRAWVKFGIWRCLYDAPKMFISFEDEKTYKHKIDEFVRKKYNKELTERVQKRTKKESQ